ncbi:phosphotransferase [Microbacterium keratanolyticum]
MARSPFTLAAAVTAAMPGAEVVGARALTANGDARFDSAVASLADGREVVLRAATDEETAGELAAESLALRALTAGAREMLPFDAPEYHGEVRVGEARALVTSLIRGFQVAEADIPAGPGAAEAIGAAIAGVHALPASVVRGAGLSERTPAEVRAEVRELVDRAAATGRVSARLTVRWREAVEADEIWHFESTVILGAAHAASFVFEDDELVGPQVVGVIGWHGLSIGDPATDLAWLSSAPDAADSVHLGYGRSALRSPDAALPIRARLLAELEFARWLVHGTKTHRADIVDDAAALLDALADGVRDEDLIPRARRTSDVDEAMSALDSVPAHAAPAADTSMHTDAYDPGEFYGADTRGYEIGASEPEDGAVDTATTAAQPRLFDPEDPDVEETAADDTAARGASADDDLATGAIDLPEPSMLIEDVAAHTEAQQHRAAEEEDAQRAARAAFQRWTNSSSE